MQCLNHPHRPNHRLHVGIRLPTCAEGGDLEPVRQAAERPFGCWDVLAIRDGETIAVQTTSRSNVSSRAKKIAEAESTPHLRRAGWKLVIHGWDKGRKGIGCE